MPYPSTISTLATPQPTDRLNNPSHSQLHQNENSAIIEIENYVGTLSSTAGSLTYDIRSPLSNGGGHVQTANKGGTGQTSYTKGDILVASSSSVLTKLAVGVDGQVPVANSSVATGIVWGATPGSKIANSAQQVSIVGLAEASIFSVNIAGSTLGTSNAIRATVYVSDFQTGNGSSVLYIGTYGGAQIASVSAVPTTNNAISSVHGAVELTIIANNSANSQRGILNVSLEPQNKAGGTASSVYSMYNSNVSSVGSGANRVFGLIIRNTVGGQATIVDGYTIERIN